jgi:ADP-ribose pyrophosphatase
VDKVVTGKGATGTREVVEHRGAAAIVPILDKNHIILVKQYRYAITSGLLEIPAGTLEQNESPDHCAARELEEETGYRSNELTKIMDFYVAPGYSTERIHVFLARDLVHTKMKTEEDEDISIESMPLENAIEKIRSSEIKDAKTICALYRAKELLNP